VTYDTVLLSVLYAPLQCTTRGVLDALVDKRDGVFKCNKEQPSTNNFVLKNKERYGDLTPGNFRTCGYHLRTDKRF
jgi:hypothetical protein